MSPRAGSGPATRELSPEVRALRRQKRELRDRMRSLPQPSVEQARRAGEAVALHLEAAEVWNGARELRMFASLPDELQTRPIFEMAVAAGRRVSFPRCVGRELEFRAVRHWEELRPGRYGLHEPGPEAELVAETPAPVEGASAVWCIPGLAFDARGSRLGRGAGYYDRALARVPGSVTVVGVGFARQCVEFVPIEAHDRRMAALLTEEGWHWVVTGGQA